MQPAIEADAASLS